MRWLRALSRPGVGAGSAVGVVRWLCVLSQQGWPWALWRKGVGAGAVL